MIKKILVANRGEIAVRVMRSCRELGIKSVAVFSEADRTSMHVRYADDAVCIGPGPSSESYLVIDKIIDAAKKTGADAIHPGYGFLSEKAEFARRCEKEGIIFIGPPAEAIEVMGDKISARQTMIANGVPVVPGTSEKTANDKEALKIVKNIGLPVIIKASAGGGGKGMRLVREESEIINALNTAKSEAKSSFGDDSVYIEKYIESPHHIEFQILADQHGTVIHLCERECSVQRRHQKVVEESPSPLMTPELREKMGKAAINAAKAVNYVGAGTIEFLADDDLNFYFLEMNTRLQVEHPITEMVVGVDLVKEQINIADGKKLTIKQKDVVQVGHAIECRIYAEDPDKNFMPCPGRINHISLPSGYGVRIDGYVYEGYEIPMFYDAMISKLITWGSNRKEAIARMKRALFEYKITGVKTSIPFLEKIMDTPDFKNGKYNTHFIENNIEFLTHTKETKKTKLQVENIALIAAYIDHINVLEENKPKTAGDAPVHHKWKAFWKKKGIFRI